VKPEIVFTFDDRARGLNGSCMLGPGVMALADCFAGLIWRVDLSDGARSATARVWLAHDTMAWDADSAVAPPPQPGINGIRHSAKTGYVYYTSTAQKVFMRVAVDPATLDPAGTPEFVAAVDNADDFCLDEEAGFAYVTRHRANTIDRVPLQPRHGSEVRHIAGDPFDETLIGPSSVAWGRNPGEERRIAYVTTDGGTTAPPTGGMRKAALLRMQLDSTH
jgi:sugar lactone lactonase YvrE